MNALWIAAGAALWALHFTVIYAFVTLACVRDAPGWASVVVVVSSVVALVGAVALVVRGYRRRATFHSWLSAGVAALAGVAIVYEALGALFLPACR